MKKYEVTVHFRRADPYGFMDLSNSEIVHAVSATVLKDGCLVFHDSVGALVASYAHGYWSTFKEVN